MLGLGFRVAQGLRFMVYGRFGVWVHGLRFRVHGLSFGLGFAF